MLAASEAPNETHPLLHSLFTSHANAYGAAELPAPRARMAEKLVVGFMEVADSQRQLEIALTLPIPPKILGLAHRVATQSTLAEMPKCRNISRGGFPLLVGSLGRRAVSSTRSA